MTVSEAHHALSEQLCAHFRCSPGPRDDLRVLTPLWYPDRDTIEVFVSERDGRRVVTDHGDAIGWLWLRSPDEDLQPLHLELIHDVCLSLDVEFDKGELTMRCDDASDIADAVMRVAQAIVRVADISFTFRLDADPSGVATANGVRAEPQTDAAQTSG